MLCCLTAVPSAVETRYMLPVYLLSYIFVLEAGWPNPLGPNRAGLRFRTPVVIAVAYATFMVIVVLVTSNATKNLHFG